MSPKGDYGLGASSRCLNLGFFWPSGGTDEVSPPRSGPILRFNSDTAHKVRPFAYGGAGRTTPNLRGYKKGPEARLLAVDIAKLPEQLGPRDIGS